MSSSSSPFLYIERGRSNTQPNTSVPGTHRPLSAEGKSSKDRNRSYSNQIGHKGGLHKFTKMFRKQQHRASGDMSSINKMRIPGFDDDFFIEQKRLPRPGSPESPKAFRRNRSNSVGSRVGLKVRKGKDREDAFFMWKPIRVSTRYTHYNVFLVKTNKDCSCFNSLTICLFKSVKSVIYLFHIIRERSVNGRVYLVDN